MQLKRTTPLSLKYRLAAFATAALMCLFVLGAALPQLAHAEPGEIVRGTVTADLPLYAECDASGEPVEWLSPGVTLQALDMGDGWFGAKFNGVDLFFNDIDAFARYTAVSSDVIRAAVIGGSLDVLYAPSEWAAPCGTFSNGATIKFCVFNDSYYMARLADGTICYIPAWRVSLYAPAEEGTLVRWAGPDGANVYESPDYDQAPLLTFEAGKQLWFADFNAEWLMASMTVDGVVRTVFVPKGQVLTEAPQEPEPTPPPVDPAPTETEWVIAKYQVASKTEPSWDSADSTVFRKGAVLTGLSTGTGWYEVVYDGEVSYLSVDDITVIPASNYSIGEQYYDISLADATRLQWNSSGDTSTWILGNSSKATYADLALYIDPSTFAPGTSGFFQFLKLDIPMGVSVDTMNAQLAGKGTLEGMGQAFHDAAYAYNINEAYLISHALHETGNGMSTLARGVWYDPDYDNGVDEDGDPLPRGKAFTSEQPNSTLVYNMYGIGAVDSDPLNGGARYAYNHGWTTPYDAVYGGAQFIGRTYFSSDDELGYGYPSTLSGQDTLYKMLYHPEWVALYREKPWHEYATDVAWANAQTYYFTQMLADYSNYSLIFEVPVYAA